MLGRSPIVVMAEDVLSERRAGVPFPPGETRVSMRRTRRFAEEPLPLLLESYDRYGPIFTLRLFHSNVVFMLGPEANHHILVSHASNFLWRDGHFRDLISLMGDGLLTIDGEFHRRSRRIMLPAFHREHLAASLATVREEADAGADQLMAQARAGAPVDVYAWTRHLALRIAMRALFGVDPDGPQARSIDAAELFEQALSFYASEYVLRVLKGPGTPLSRLRSAAAKLDTLIYGEIARRRETGERGLDVLSLLLDAEDEDGDRLSDLQIRDEVMTLMFAGHDTTTSTVSFMFYELARHPRELELLAREQAELCPEGPSDEQLLAGGLPRLEMVIDETLRKYPPAWVGPRRAVQTFEFAGHTVPARAFVNYCSWASHRLPDVFPEPDRFLPERFSEEGRAAMQKGAYVPFGGGSRTCIGMRFGQLEVRTIASRLIALSEPELPEGFALRIRQMPTLSPREGLPLLLHERAAGGAARPLAFNTGPGA